MEKKGWDSGEIISQFSTFYLFIYYLLFIYLFFGKESFKSYNSQT